MTRDDGSDPPNPLAYASPVDRRVAPDRLRIPSWLLVVSALPPALLASLFVAAQLWRRHFAISDIERFSARIWIIVAAMSLIWTILLIALPRKSWLAVLALSLHLLIVLGTIGPPGCIIIPFLMHWSSGPGG